MAARIETIAAKKLVGKRMKMSLSNNRTTRLWQNFMSRRKEIQAPIGTTLYSMQVFAPSYFDNFSPDTEFEKWATVEVANFDAVPDDLETIVLPEGLYAVFLHQGPASAGAKTFQYIFGTWLPNSAYTLDERPHFEILGEKYKNEDPSSEEEICIPIKPKK
jgi:AraC family transcriptional regulator